MSGQVGRGHHSWDCLTELSCCNSASTAQRNWQAPRFSSAFPSSSAHPQGEGYPHRPLPSELLE
ncbi:hypothetical protein P7K49_013381 [Saguinus oedipus]|uniref:Uncharacterized protein n=1 Tax=Saguinus oedipus TaxID=9490 RepID=A0ABQ9VGB7_SAGOE|nr:hypothetical protein P7K49_013381 [Saguinus oedipus]